MTEETEISPDDLDIPDDALAEIAGIAPSLSQQERKYVYWRSVANPPMMAFIKSGYAGTGWRLVETRPRVREALMDLNELLEPQYRVTQRTVVGILMEAVDMARMKEQPKVLVEAAKELAAVTGVGAATKIQIDQHTQFSLAQKEETKALRHMPRSGLEELVGIQRALPSNIMEGEFEEVRSV